MNEKDKFVEGIKQIFNVAKSRESNHVQDKISSLEQNVLAEYGKIKAQLRGEFVEAKRELEHASFRAYSHITADERQLHGNVGTVVHLETAIAILNGIQEKEAKPNET